MKKSILFFIIPIVMTILISLYFFSDSPLTERDRYEQFLLQKAIAFSEDEKIPEDELKAPDEPGMAAFQEYKKTVDPALRYVPKKRLLKAYKYTTQMEQLKEASDYEAPLEWTETGADMGGRTRAIMFDPNDPTYNKVWAGGVTGGLWYIDDITSASAQWVPIGDFWSSLAISSISYDPNNTEIFYVGTGEAETATVTYRESSGLGVGIYKSTDGGVNWALLESTENFQYITDIAVRNESGISVIYACVVSGTYEGPDHESQPEDGLYRSTNGGQTWNQVLPDISGSNDPYSPADIEIAANGRIFVGTMENLDLKGGATVLYSDNGLSGSWTIYDHYNDVISADDNRNIPTRTIIAVSPSDPNRVYAQFAGGSFGGFSYSNGKYIAQSQDGGATWSSVPIPDDNWSTLAWHCFILQVDPSNPDVLFTGGLDLWKSSNAGSTWDRVSNWSLMYDGGGGAYVHADQHNIQYKPESPNSAIFSTDGGVFLSSTSNQNFPVFVERNKGYNTLQFYSCAINPLAGNNEFLAGAQDNGTTLHKGSPVDINDMISGGDGAFCFWDENEANIFITSYQRSRYQIWHNDSKVYSDNERTGTFISPGDYDYENNILYSNAVESFPNTKNVLYRLSDIPANPTREIINIGTTSNLPFSCITYSPYSLAETSTLFVGSESGKLYKVTNAQSNSPTAVEIGSNAFPSAYMSCVAVGESEDELLVVFSNYGVSSVWLTKDGGGTWLEKEGNLPDMPIRWAVFHPENNNQALLATEIGVWATKTLNAVEPEWTPAKDGMANVRVDMLRLRKSDNTILAATHGRGLFYAEYLVDESPATTILSYEEPFDESLNDCLSYSVLGDTKGWYWYENDKTVGMNGYNSGELEEDWLILPGINFDNYLNEGMKFDSWYKYGSDDADNYLKLLYSSVYPGTGDPSEYTWTEIPYTQPTDAETWTFSGNIDLRSIVGTSVYLAFKYHYNPGSYRLWQVDNLFIYEGFVGVTPAINIVDAAQVYANNDRIYFKFNNIPKEEPRVEVFNTVGQKVFSCSLVPNTLSSFRLNEKPGIYIVRLRTDGRTQTQKVIIR